VPRGAEDRGPTAFGDGDEIEFFENVDVNGVVVHGDDFVPVPVELADELEAEAPKISQLRDNCRPFLPYTSAS
jgi:hypothetical protein